MLSTADPSPKLMKLCQTKTLRVFDQHHTGIRDIDSDLEHGRADQSVRLASPKAFHDFLLLQRLNSTVSPLAKKGPNSFPPQLVFRSCRFHIQLFTFVD